jgi:pyruvate/2-oxoglutarate dehydrogenase complex dihydrolipoamide dehydrogenase (E3) component
MEVNRIFAEQLGVTITEMGFIQVAPPYFETTVPGVFAVGDCASIFKTVSVPQDPARSAVHPMAAISLQGVNWTVMLTHSQVPQALSMGSFAAQGISSQLCLVHDV